MRQISQLSGVWSKSVPFKPKNNIQSHIFINKKPFKASFEKDPIEPPSMSLILAGEYARIWQQEHCEFVHKNYSNRNDHKKETKANLDIVKRFYQWLDNHKAKINKQKKYCCNIGIQ